jgi:hypothetical protein
MKLPVIRALAQNHSLEEIEKAAGLFETERRNPLNVTGDDEGEILTHHLMAMEIRKKMEKQGLSLNDAIREHSNRIKKIITVR